MVLMNISSSDFREKTVSRTDFEMQKFILDINFIHKDA